MHNSTKAIEKIKEWTINGFDDKDMLQLLSHISKMRKAAVKDGDIEPHIQELLEMRYLRKTPDGKLLEHTWQDIARRVSRTIAAGDLLNNVEISIDSLRHLELAFFWLIESRIFLPNSPTLFNAGTGAIDKKPELYEKPVVAMQKEDYLEIAHLVEKDFMHQLAACFVIDVDDDIESIMETAKEIALITKSGGGIGLNISALRSQGSPVHGTSGHASGPVSFLHMYNTVLQTIEQGYKRRGAGMCILNAKHKDIKKFIAAKHDNDGNSVLNMFNLSVGIQDEEDVEAIINNEDGLLDLIAHNIWASGDPGIIFLDTINKTNPDPNNPIKSTNPCGEEPLWPYTSCNLGSINLYDLALGVESLASNTANVEDLTQFYNLTFAYALTWVSTIATRFLDDVITISHYPLDKIEYATKKKYRPVGLGIMGYASLLYHLKQRYSQSATYLRDILATIEGVSALTSHYLVSELGRDNFGRFDSSKYKESEYLPLPITLDYISSLDMNTYCDYDFYKELTIKTQQGKRNIITTTIAPTGSLSTIAFVSSGLEPIFSHSYTRMINKPDGSRVSVEIRERSLPTNTSKDDLKSIYEVSQELTPYAHYNNQQEAQKFVSSAISKTINLPNDYNVEDIKNFLLTIFKDRKKLPVLKGLTMYRDGSLATQVLKKKDEPKKEKTEDRKEIEVTTKTGTPLTLVIDTANKLHPKGRKDTLPAYVKKFRTEKGTVYITVTYTEDEGVIEVFISDGHEKAEIIGRLTSLALRSGIALEEILEQLEKIGKRSFAYDVAKEIRNLVAEIEGKPGQETTPDKPVFKNQEEKEAFITEHNLIWNSKGFYQDPEGNTYCSNCLSKNTLTITEGCIVCQACGVGKCN